MKIKNSFIPWNEGGGYAPAFSRDLQTALDKGKWFNVIHKGRKLKVLHVSGSGLFWYKGDIVYPEGRQMFFTHADVFKDTPKNRKLLIRVCELERARVIVAKSINKEINYLYNEMENFKP